MPLDTQINLVEKLFKDVPKRENFEMPNYNKIKPYDENDLSYFYKIVPVQDGEKLIFKWVFPYCENYRAKPLAFFNSLLGHEGPNSLTTCLKKENLITDLSSFTEDYANVFTLLEIRLELTKKGFDNYKNVILIVLKYIDTIKKKEINERFFNEEKNLRQIDFDNKSKKTPVSFTQLYVDNFIL